MATSFTSIKVVLDKILRDHIFDGLSLEFAVDSTVDFFHIVGVPDMFIQQEYKTLVGQTEEGKDNPSMYYRAVLPSDFVSMDQLTIDGIPARYATDTLHQQYANNNIVEDWSPTILPAKGTYRPPVDYTYSISNNVIYVSEKKCKLQMTYKAIPVVPEGTDQEGIPMVPDDPRLHRALKAFIERQFLMILWRNGKIADKVFEQADQEYTWAVGAYQAESRNLDLSKAESFYNSWSTLIPRVNEFANRFRNNGTKEIMRRH